MNDRPRCGWANDPLLARYHDEEWGSWPEGDDALFEALTLEVFQSGLSWRTILHKREGFRRAFAGFAIDAVAAFDDEDVARLLAERAIVRHEGKIRATIANAKAARALQREHGSLGDWLRALPRDPVAAQPTLRRHFAFVGPTTCASFYATLGLAPGAHEPHCWRAGKAPLRP